MSSTRSRRGRRPVWTTAVLGLLGSLGLVAASCGVAPDHDSIDAPEQRPLGNGSCVCPNGSLYDGSAIPPASTHCDMLVCGKDLLTYECGPVAAGAPNGWKSIPTLPCSSLICPGAGVFCGNDVLNGVPSSLYTCPGSGKIPTEWAICPAACKKTGASTAVCGAAPATCACGALGDGYGSTTCGEQHCTATGQGTTHTMMMCTASGWQNLGQSLGETCEPTALNDCTACKGMQDASGKEIITTACGHTVCGLGKANDESFVCTPSGWVDVGTACAAPKPGDPKPLGKCPSLFKDQNQISQPVEPYQTFCGGQKVLDAEGKPSIDFGGDPGSLYACEHAGAEPKLVKTCAQGSPCMPVSKIQGYVQKHPTSNADVLVRDWDRCFEPCPAWDDDFLYVTGRLCTPLSSDQNCVRHYACGQNPISGRPGTRYSCFANGCNKKTQSCSYDVPYPAYDCTYEGAGSRCAPGYGGGEDSQCDKAAHAPPWGVPPPVVADNERCSALQTYQGIVVPAKEATLGKKVCGIGMQVFRCETRALGRPDGWVATNEPCGTDCAGCALDVFGNLPPKCWSKCKGTENPAQCPVLQGCDDTTQHPEDIPCKSPNPSAVKPSTPTPGYCGDNQALGVDGDPRMLYTCKAQCPRLQSPVRWEDCTAASETWTLRKYVFARADFCDHGCRITDVQAASDECILLPGLGFGDAVDNRRVVQNLGHYNAIDGQDLDGTHLGEDVKPQGTNGVGAVVRAVAPGKVLWVGPNSSQYHATVLLEHWVKDPGEKAAKRYCSFYSHLNLGSVYLHEAGDKVQKGEQIATIESWGTILGVGTPSTADDNTHLHHVILDDGFCKAFENGGGPCGYDAEPTDLWSVGYNDDATAKLSITGGAAKGGCSATVGKTLYAPRVFATEHAQARVCASPEDCQ